MNGMHKEIAGWCEITGVFMKTAEHSSLQEKLYDKIY